MKGTEMCPKVKDGGRGCFIFWVGREGGWIRSWSERLTLLILEWEVNVLEPMGDCGSRIASTLETYIH